MDTLTIAFDDRNMMSVIKSLINSMNGVHIVSAKPIADTTDMTALQEDYRYKISPRIKAMEVGSSLPEDISSDYKKEMNEIKVRRYL